jgi:hypothetical protein
MDSEGPLNGATQRAAGQQGVPLDSEGPLNRAVLTTCLAPGTGFGLARHRRQAAAQR